MNLPKYSSNLLSKFPNGFRSLSFKLSRLLPPDTESRITNCSSASLECLRWQLIATPNAQIVICTFHLQMLQDLFGSNGLQDQKRTHVSNRRSVGTHQFDRLSSIVPAMPSVTPSSRGLKICSVSRKTGSVSITNIPTWLAILTLAGHWPLEFRLLSIGSTAMLWGAGTKQHILETGKNWQSPTARCQEHVICFTIQWNEYV